MVLSSVSRCMSHSAVGAGAVPCFSVIVGVVSVLFVSVCVAVRPTSCSAILAGSYVDVDISPDHAGVAQVPSPLQYVLEDADVQLLRLVTGKFPVTSAVKST